MVVPGPMAPIWVCGEALVDLVPADDDGRSWQALPGGSPFNTAVALARLRIPTQFIGRFSDDAFGTSMRLHLARSGAGQALAVRTPDPSTMAVVSLDAEQKAAYTFYWDATTNAGWQPSELPELPDERRPCVLHIGSLAAVLPPSSDVLYDWFATMSTSVPITYDLNVRPSLLPDADVYRHAVQRWLGLATVAKASDDDLEFLYPGAPPVEVVQSWLRDFPQLTTAVVTLGSEGALALERGSDEPVHVRTLRVDVTDTVGAGDTFTAGFLHGRYGLGLGLTDSVIRATVAGALVCTRRGAAPPTGLEVDGVVAARGASLVG
jgi:fructokinase